MDYICTGIHLFTTTRGTPLPTFNLADLFEVAADTLPERLAVVAGDERRTYAELDERATRFANHVVDAGVRPGAHVAILSWNRMEWLEAMLGCFKARAVPINVNYRYAADELAHVLRDGEVVALVTERAFLPLVDEVRPGLPALAHVVVLEDGTPAGETSAGSDADPGADPDAVGYEDALAAASPRRDGAPRSPDDRYVLYTGGTTGAPKGVVWRQEDVFMVLGGGIDFLTGEKVADEWELANKAVDGGALALVQYTSGSTSTGSTRARTRNCSYASRASAPICTRHCSSISWSSSPPAASIRAPTRSRTSRS